MNEFLNRVSAQRMVLQAVNSINLASSDLLGLSAGAIDRWVIENRLGQEAPIVKLVRRAAERLFCLANKSQEQVTEEYLQVSEEIAIIAREIKSISAKPN